MKVGMVGSRNYQNRQKIKNLIFELKQKFGDKLEIVGTGDRYGAGLFVKKACTDLAVSYTEFPPLHEQWNSNCPEPPYMYGKPYSPKYYAMRNTQIVEYSDMIIGFSVDGEKKSLVDQIERFSKKNDKDFVLLR